MSLFGRCGAQAAVAVLRKVTLGHHSNTMLQPTHHGLNHELPKHRDDARPSWYSPQHADSLMAHLSPTHGALTLRTELLATLVFETAMLHPTTSGHPDALLLST